MKGIKSFSKIVVALILAAALMTFAACDVLDGFFNNTKGDGKVYSVTLNADGGTFTTDLTEYTSGTVTSLPSVGTKEHYTFDGWYVSDDFSGSAVTKISATATGDKEYWAKWVPDNYVVKFYIDDSVWQNDMSTYAYNSTESTSLPVPELDGATFNGWYTSADLTGNKVSEIAAGDYGVKSYYGAWVYAPTGGIIVTAYGGYEEGAYIEFKTVEDVTNYTVSYKTAGASSYKDIDSELVRIDTENSKVRADVVGIAAGDYTLRVTAGTNIVEEDVTVTAYDRSGYAHFNASAGVGAYNNDGTPKTGAYIVYVNEQNKNDVAAPWNSKIKGIGNILTNASSSDKPLIVRIIGTVGAATWNADNWNVTKHAALGNKTLKEYYASYISSSTNKITTDAAIVGINGKALTTVKNSPNLTQEYLLANGFNTLDTSEYAELNGLSSKATYSATSGESGFDSAWNNCSISGASNVTVEGIGIDAQICQWGMTWVDCSSIEVRNIIFKDYTEDACSFEGNSSETSQTVDGFTFTRFWVHNCSFYRGVNYWDVCAEQDKGDGDGSVDLKRLAYVTLSYNYFYNTHKTGLVGADDASMTACVTFHHNYYEACQARLPLARNANMHMYNNYYKGTSDTCLSIRSGGYAFVEYCCFDDCHNPVEYKVGTKTVNGNYLTGFIKLYNCDFSNSSYSSSNYVKVATSRDAKYANDNVYDQYFDTNSAIFYYENGASKVSNLLTSYSDIRTRIPQLAGVHKN